MYLNDIFPFILRDEDLSEVDIGQDQSTDTQKNEAQWSWELRIFYVFWVV